MTVISRTPSGNPVVPLPRDVQRIADLAASLTGGDPLRGLFQMRFPVGVRLKNAPPGSPGSVTGLQWLMSSAPDGPGWSPLGEWSGLADVARRAGRGAMTLVMTPDAAGGAYAVHNGSDGVAWLFHVRSGHPPVVIPLADFDAAGLAAPRSVAVIDWCAEVLQLAAGEAAQPC